MAITKVRTVVNIGVRPAEDSSAADTDNAKHPTVEIQYTHTFDDSTDDDLPIDSTEWKTLSKYVSDGGAATTYTNEDQLVQDVCGAIWS